MKAQQKNSEAIAVIFEGEVDLNAVSKEILGMFLDAIKQTIEEEADRNV